MRQSRTLTNFLFLEDRKKESEISDKAKAEARLVERIGEGDEEAFNELFKKLSPLVHGIVLARVPRDEVDDLVQEVFISAFNNLHKLRDKNAVSPWIARIARNRAVEYYRRRKPTEELPENLTHRDSAKNEAQEILDTLLEMPDAYRETLILRLVEGMTGPEIAEQTGLTHSSVRVNLHRGMKLLRSRLGIEVKE